MRLTFSRLPASSEGVTQTCPNCKAIAPFVDELMKKYGDVRFYKYDVDAADDIAQELGARQVPTFSIFKDGMIEDGVTGAKKEELERILKQVHGG